MIKKEIMLCVVDDMTRELEIDSVTETYTRRLLEEQMKLLKKYTTGICDYVFKSC